MAEFALVRLVRAGPFCRPDYARSQENCQVPSQKLVLAHSLRRESTALRAYVSDHNWFDPEEEAEELAELGLR